MPLFSHILNKLKCYKQVVGVYVSGSTLFELSVRPHGETICLSVRFVLTWAGFHKRHAMRRKLNFPRCKLQLLCNSLGNYFPKKRASEYTSAAFHSPLHRLTTRWLFFLFSFSSEMKGVGSVFTLCRRWRDFLWHNMVTNNVYGSGTFPLRRMGPEKERERQREGRSRKEGAQTASFINPFTVDSGDMVGKYVRKYLRYFTSACLACICSFLQYLYTEKLVLIYLCSEFNFITNFDGQTVVNACFQFIPTNNLEIFSWNDRVSYS